MAHSPSYVAGHVSYDKVIGHSEESHIAVDVTVYALTQEQLDLYFGCTKRAAGKSKGTYQRVEHCLGEVKPSQSAHTGNDGNFSFYPTILPEGVSLLFVSSTGRYLAGPFDLSDHMDIHLEYFDR